MQLPLTPQHAARVLLAARELAFREDQPRDDHGRWTGDGGTDVALDRLNKLLQEDRSEMARVAGAGSRDAVSAQRVFGHPLEELWPQRDKDFRVEEVDLTTLHPTQRVITRDTIKAFIRDPKLLGDDSRRLPVVIRTRDGRNVVRDGHNRLAAAILRGERRAPVALYDEVPRGLEGGFPLDPRRARNLLLRAQLAVRLAAFNPEQARDEKGRWTDGAGQGKLTKLIVKSGVGSDMVHGLYTTDPTDAMATEFDLDTVRMSEVERAREELKRMSQTELLRKFPSGEFTAYRGRTGTEKREHSTISLTLDPSTARFHGNKFGAEGRVTEHKVKVSDVLSYSESIGRGGYDEEEIVVFKSGLRGLEFNPDQPRDEHGQWTDSGPATNQRDLDAYNAHRKISAFKTHGATLDDEDFELVEEVMPQSAAPNSVQVVDSREDEGRTYFGKYDADGNLVAVQSTSYDSKGRPRFDLIATRSGAERKGYATQLLNWMQRHGHNPVSYVHRTAGFTDKGKAFILKWLDSLRIKTAEFNPDQERDDHGRWTDGGSYVNTVSSKLAPAAVTVDGREVLDDVPNMSSIGASLNDYEILDDIREVPLSEFYNQDQPSFYSRTEESRVKDLAEEIRASGKIAPLIVVYDDDPRGPYILEGGHRFDALKIIGAKSFPALVVIDTEKKPRTAEFNPDQARDEHGRWTTGGSFATSDEVPSYVGAEPGDRISKVQDVPISQVEISETKIDENTVAGLMQAMRRGEPLPAVLVEFSHDTDSGNGDVVNIIDGHNRFEAAKRLGYKDLPVRVKVAAEDWPRVKKYGGMEIRVGAFNPDQERDERGRWTGSGAVSFNAARARLPLDADGVLQWQTAADGSTSVAGIHENRWTDWAHESDNINDLLAGETVDYGSYGEPLDDAARANLKQTGELIQAAAETHAVRGELWRGEQYASLEDVAARYARNQTITFDRLTAGATSADIAVQYAEGDKYGDKNKVPVVLRIQRNGGTLGIQTIPNTGVLSGEVVMPRGETFRVSGVIRPGNDRYSPAVRENLGIPANAVVVELYNKTPAPPSVQRYTPWSPKKRDLRTAARDANTPLHKAAAKQVKPFSVAIRYAFASARKAMRPVLAELRTAEFDPDQPRDEQGQWTDTGASHPPATLTGVKIQSGARHRVRIESDQGFITTAAFREDQPRDEYGRWTDIDEISAPDTPEFRAFFEGSKVVDKDGKPLVVHHSGSFDELEGIAPTIGPEGMHFGTEDAAKERPYVKSVDDTIRSIEIDRDKETGRYHYTMDGYDSWDLDENGFATESEARADAEEKAVETGENTEFDEAPPITSVYLSIKNPKRVEDAGADWSRVVARAKAEGHDGLIYRNQFEDKGKDSYVVFEPNQIKSVKNRGTYDRKSSFITLAGPSIEPAIKALRVALKKTLQPALQRALIAGGDVGWAALPKRRRSLRAAARDKFDGERREAVAWARKHAAELIDQVSDSARDRIRRAVANITEGEDWDEQYEKILAAVGDDDRAELIARHEVHTAVSEGQRQAWDQAVDAGVLTGDEKRYWMAIGPNPCPVCVDLDGESADLDGEYEDGIVGPPAHVGCYCTEQIVAL